jgi:hypothetical protein
MKQQEVNITGRFGMKGSALNTLSPPTCSSGAARFCAVALERKVRTILLQGYELCVTAKRGAGYRLIRSTHSHYIIRIVRTTNSKDLCESFMTALHVWSSRAMLKR